MSPCVCVCVCFSIYSFTIIYTHKETDAKISHTLQSNQANHDATASHEYINAPSDPSSKYKSLTQYDINIYIYIYIQHMVHSI